MASVSLPHDFLERSWFYTSMPWTKYFINRNRRRRGQTPLPWRGPDR